MSAVSSELAEIECLRTLDRLRVMGRITAAEYPRLREEFDRLWQGIEVVALSRIILRRVAEPFAAPLGTLDAIHLSTALFHRERRGSSFVVATHDSALGGAAQAHGLRVIGLSGHRRAT